MDKKTRKQDMMVLGGTLFSMFFGAGNLIFPPALGLAAGTKWLPALVGFFLTGIGLPLLGVVASAKSGGDINTFGSRVSPGFSKILGLVIVMCIGPFIAIPRTGATTFEIAIQPTFPNFNPLLFSFIYFGIALALVINPTNIVDKIGKVLTPGLLIILALIIIFGIVNPIGSPTDVGAEKAFTDGFQGGYQTMDAFAALLFGGIIVKALKAKGYDDEEDQISMTLKSGIIAIVGLTFVYGGLGYLGATASGTIDPGVTKVELIRIIADNSLKGFGTFGLAIAVSLACLTTSVGLITTVGQFFEELSKGKLKYKPVVIVTSIFSAVLAVVGVETMVSFSAPILSFLYPMVIVMTVFTVGIKENSNLNILKGAVIVTIIMSILEVISGFDKAGFLKAFFEFMPLYSLGLPWVVPAIVGGIVGSLVPTKATEKEKEKESGLN